MLSVEKGEEEELSGLIIVKVEKENTRSIRVKMSEKNGSKVGG